MIAALEDNDDPIISPAGSCTYAVKSYPTYLADEPAWALRAEKGCRAYAGSHLFYCQQTGRRGRRCQPAGQSGLSPFVQPDSQAGRERRAAHAVEKTYAVWNC